MSINAGSLDDPPRAKVIATICFQSCHVELCATYLRPCHLRWSTRGHPGHRGSKYFWISFLNCIKLYFICMQKDGVSLICTSLFVQSLIMIVYIVRVGKCDQNHLFVHPKMRLFSLTHYVKGKYRFILILVLNISVLIYCLSTCKICQVELYKECVFNKEI